MSGHICTVCTSHYVRLVPGISESSYFFKRETKLRPTLSKTQIREELSTTRAKVQNNLYKISESSYFFKRETKLRDANPGRALHDKSQSAEQSLQKLAVPVPQGKLTDGDVSEVLVVQQAALFCRSRANVVAGPLGQAKLKKIAFDTPS